MIKLRCIKNKKATDDFLNETVIFILLNIAFFAIMLLIAFRAGSDVASYEQKYAKKISLIIDSSMPGTVFSINIDELVNIMTKNGRAIDDVFKIGNNKVTVKLTDGKGYSFPYFSDYDVNVALHFERNTRYVDFYVN
ncbi:MAG TPA: hypothetical protein P5277_03790 [Candidatus Paceibacterota bacterium]|nr:hypothetical protein [Candidatus Paceibacterota bacterium]